MLQTKFSEEDLKLNLTDVPRLPNTLSISFVNRNGRDVLSACSFVVASTGSACHSDKIEVSRKFFSDLTVSIFLKRTDLKTNKQKQTRVVLF